MIPYISYLANSLGQDNEARLDLEMSQFRIIVLTASCVYLCILKHWDKINLAISVLLYIYVGACILFKILSVRTYLASNYAFTCI